MWAGSARACPGRGAELGAQPLLLQSPMSDVQTLLSDFVVMVGDSPSVFMVSVSLFVIITVVAIMELAGARQ